MRGRVRLQDGVGGGVGHRLHDGHRHDHDEQHEQDRAETGHHLQQRSGGGQQRDHADRRLPHPAGDHGAGDAADREQGRDQAVRAGAAVQRAGDEGGEGELVVAPQDGADRGDHGERDEAAATEEERQAAAAALGVALARVGGGRGEGLLAGVRLQTQEGDDRGHEEERHAVDGVRAGRADRGDADRREGGAGEPADAVHDGAEGDGGGDVLLGHEVVAEQGGGGAVDGGDQAGDAREDHQQGHVEHAEGDQQGRGERHQGQHGLAHTGGELTGPAVHHGAAEQAEEQAGGGLDGERQARRGGGAGELQHEQVLHRELHPGAEVRHQVGGGPPAHAAAAQAAPRGTVGGGGGRRRAQGSCPWSGTAGRLIRAQGAPAPWWGERGPGVENPAGRDTVGRGPGKRRRATTSLSCAASASPPSSQALPGGGKFVRCGVGHPAPPAGGRGHSDLVASPPTANERCSA